MTVSNHYPRSVVPFVPEFPHKSAKKHSFRAKTTRKHTQNAFFNTFRFVMSNLFRTFAAENGNITHMETQLKTVQMTLPRADWTFLKRLSANMGWQARVVSHAREGKVKMTETEFREKLEQSSAHAAAGQYVEMRADETVDQFVDRMLCM